MVCCTTFPKSSITRALFTAIKLMLVDPSVPSLMRADTGQGHSGSLICALSRFSLCLRSADGTKSSGQGQIHPIPADPRHCRLWPCLSSECSQGPVPGITSPQSSTRRSPFPCHITTDLAWGWRTRRDHDFNFCFHCRKPETWDLNHQKLANLRLKDGCRPKVV